MQTGHAIVEYLRRQRAALVDFTAQLARAESPSSHPEAQAAPMQLLWQALTDVGFEARHEAGRRSGGCLLAQPAPGRFPLAVPEEPADPNGAARQLLVGHCDTVWPLGTLKTMPLQIEADVMRGPGVYDMKGGLAQMVFALRALRALSLAPTVVPLVLINSDEEIGSTESRAAIEAAAQTAARALVLEPALGRDGKLKTARKGVGRFQIVVKGRAAHAGLDPEKGVSAVLALSHVVQQLFALNDFARGVSVNVGLIEGGVQANVIAPESRATVDVRAPTLADAERLSAAIHGLTPPLPGVTLAISGQFGRPPLERTPGNQALWRTAQALGAQIGLALEEGMAGGGSDGNLTSRYTPTLDGLGPVGDGAHAAHEFVYIDKLVERTALLALLLLEPAPAAERPLTAAVAACT